MTKELKPWFENKADKYRGRDGTRYEDYSGSYPKPSNLSYDNNNGDNFIVRQFKAIPRYLKVLMIIFFILYFLDIPLTPWDF